MLETLKFESDFFSLNFGETNQINENKNRLCNYDIVQIRSKEKIPNATLINTNFIFEDTRIAFSKVITKDTKQMKYSVLKAEKMHIHNLSDKLLAPLVEHSRFRNITSFKTCLNFYKLWAEKSILGTFDDEAYIIKKEKNIIGFISLKINNRQASIGLLSIDPLFEAKGLAYSLIFTIEQHLYNRGVNTLSVITEGKNERAIKFYTKYGFTQSNINYWYYWRR